MTPYWEDADAGLQLYLGDMRDVLPALGLQADCIVTDPPYAETSLAWDRWPKGWPEYAANAASSMWCFGSMRMFLDRGHEFAASDWKLSQDVVWRKQVAAGAATDRFRRCHEVATHWYRGPWSSIYHEAQRTAHYGKNQGVVRQGAKEPAWGGARGAAVWADDGTRLMQTVIEAPNMWKRGIHPTEKPLGILDPLIRYACPPGGLVVDPFAGSGSTLDAARQSGRRAIGIEANEEYAEAAKRRLSALTLPV